MIREGKYINETWGGLIEDAIEDGEIIFYEASNNSSILICLQQKKVFVVTLSATDDDEVIVSEADNLVIVYKYKVVVQGKKDVVIVQQDLNEDALAEFVKNSSNHVGYGFFYKSNGSIKRIPYCAVKGKYIKDTVNRHPMLKGNNVERCEL